MDDPMGTVKHGSNDVRILMVIRQWLMPGASSLETRQSEMFGPESDTPIFARLAGHL